MELRQTQRGGGEAGSTKKPAGLERLRLFCNETGCGDPSLAGLLLPASLRHLAPWQRQRPSGHGVARKMRAVARVKDLFVLV